MFNFQLHFSSFYRLCSVNFYLPNVKHTKAGKMQSIASSALLTNLFKNYFEGAKIWWLFAQLYKNFINCFVLEFSTVDTVSRF